MVRKTRKDVDFLPLHRPHFLAEERQPFRTPLVRGQIVTFRYDDKKRWVFVIAADWEGKLHGLDVTRLPRLTLLPLFDVSPKLTEEQFYTQFVDTPLVQEWQAYRSYDLPKIGTVALVIYNNNREPDELSAPGMKDEPETPVVPDADLL